MKSELSSVSLVNCRVCGRVLKKPASVEKGIGPVCAKRLLTEGGPVFSDPIEDDFGPDEADLVSPLKAVGPVLV